MSEHREQVELRRALGPPRPRTPLRQNVSRERLARPTMQHGADHVGAVALAQHIQDVRTCPQNLLLQPLASRQARQGHQQAG